MEWFMLVVFILFQCLGFVFGESCFIDDTNRYEYCDTGCCGRRYENNRRCCTDTDIKVWIIVASVIGGILFICFIVAVVCCFIKSKGRKGMVVSPSYPTNQTTTVYQVPINPSTNPYPYQATVIGPPAYMANPPPYSLGPPQYQQQQNGQIYASAPPLPYPLQQHSTTGPYSQQPPQTQPVTTHQTGDQQVPPPPQY